MRDQSNYWFIGAAAFFFLVCCLCTFAAIGGASFSFLQLNNRDQGSTIESTPESWIVNSPTPLPEKPIVLPTATLSKQGSNDIEVRPVPSPTSVNPNQVSTETLETLSNTLVPISDLLDLAVRLNGKTGLSRTIEPPAVPYQVGDRRNFWVRDRDTGENFLVDAEMAYVTDHMYFWIADGVRYNQQDLAALAQDFENNIYPTDRNFFGSEWTPGVDNDPHIYILYTPDLGTSIAGYYSSVDEYSQPIYEFSNVAEMFMMNSDTVGLEERFTYGVLAHEFQHMIHWYQDRNEDSWLNEGFSELAAFLNGYYESGFDWLYIQDPDLQLNDWPNDPNQTTPHYGSGFLFLNYFLGRFGNQATQSVVSHEENGLTSIDLTLESLGIKDPLTGMQIQTDEVFLDWVITNVLQNEAVSDGRFAYALYDQAPQASVTESFSRCPVSKQERSVHQYAVDYISITCKGESNLKFQGVPKVSVLPVDPYSGDYAFWSNKGDESDMTLTRTFDFRPVTGPLTLRYRAWYDLELNYDYVYLAASTDGNT